MLDKLLFLGSGSGLDLACFQNMPGLGYNKTIQFMNPLIPALFLFSLCFPVAAFGQLDSIPSGKAPEAMNYQELTERLEAFYGEGDVQNALETAILAREAAAKEYGKEHDNYLESLNNLGYLYATVNEYEQALPLYLEAKEKAEKNPKISREVYGNTLNFLGLLSHDMGEYEQELSYYKKALEVIRSSSQGKENPLYGFILNNMGLLYMDMEAYEKALTVRQEALENIEATLGKNHSYYGSGVANLGLLYHQMGEYEKALPLYLEALKNAEKSIGKAHYRYAYRLEELAELYQDMGEYDKALPLFLQARELVEKSWGKSHSDYGYIQEALSILYNDMKAYDKALPLMLEAVEISEKTKGKDTPEYGARLSNLARLYSDMGEYDKALPIFLEALGQAEANYGKGHSEYGIRLFNLGALYIRMGRYDEARALLLEALENIEKNLGKTHQVYSHILKYMGLSYQISGDDGKALPIYLALNENINFQAQERFPFLSDRLQASFLKKMRSGFDQLQSFIFSHPEEAALVSAGFDNQLFYKGLLQSNRSRLLRNLRQHPDSILRQQYQEWEDLHKMLARQYQKRVSQRLPELDSLENEAEKLEVRLANASSSFRQARKKVEWKEVQLCLKPGEAAIEFSHFRYYRQGVATDSVLYVAFVLRSGTGQPQIVPLFEESSLNGLLALAQQGDQQGMGSLYAARGVEPRRPQSQAYASLDSLLWRPLESLLEGVHTIYYAPSGWLHRINLGAVGLNGHTTIGDKYQLHTLSSTGSLTAEAEAQAYTNRNALLLGGIAYERDTQPSLGDPAEPETMAPNQPALETLAALPRGGATAWQYLPGTAQEVGQASKLLAAAGYEVTAKYGQDATEESLKNLPQPPRILHIATHGFFFPDSQDTEGSVDQLSIELPPVQLSEHPMVRSGLILAGANHSWMGNPPLQGREDGILTAYEISRMDLSGTELVVLSACETGLGDIQGSEGVYGLQRAFKIAGARYVIMSLWQVPDEPTRELMTAFYREWLSGKPMREAFREAQRQMRGKYEDPYYWAAFVLLE